MSTKLRRLYGEARDGVMNVTVNLSAPVTWRDLAKAMLGLCLYLSTYNYFVPGYFSSLSLETVTVTGSFLMFLPIWVMSLLLAGWGFFSIIIEGSLWILLHFREKKP